MQLILQQKKNTSYIIDKIAREKQQKELTVLHTAF